jgi:hypothetical protein
MNRTRFEGARILILAAGFVLVGACASGRKDATTETAAPTADDDVPTEDAFRRGSEALVRIETPHRVGGGFVVGADGVIVTGYSLLQHEVTARAVLADGTMFPIDRVLASDPERDLAVVQIGAEGLPQLKLAGKPPRTGQRVIAVGHAIGMAGPSVAQGVVGSTPTVKEAGSFQISSPLPAGFFGAPVLDVSGDAIGIIGVLRPDGATVLTSASIAGMLRGAKSGAGDTMEAFGKRTRDDAGWKKTLTLEPTVLDDCSMSSRERMWGEIEHAIGSAAPVFDLGGTEASFRVMEGAVLYLSREVNDCKELLDVLLTAAASGRDRADSMEGATGLAEALHAVLELLFAQSHALGPMAGDVPRAWLRPRA